MNARKYRIVLILIALSIIAIAIPSPVSATVYMPPTPLPVDRTSISGYRLIASVMPVRSGVPALQIHYM